MKEGTVLVTGADRGLGLAVVKRLVESKTYVVFAGQYMPDEPQLLTLKKKYPNHLHIIPMDVGCTQSVKDAAQSVAEILEGNPLDAIIGNAAIIGWDDTRYDDITDAQMMLDVYNVNGVGNVRVVEHFIPLLKSSAYKRINLISSEAGSITNCRRENFFWYGMSKAALNYYAKTLYNRYQKDGYRILLYHPGWIKSYMKGYVDELADLSPEIAAQYLIQQLFHQEHPKNELIFIDETGEEMAF